MLPIRSDYTAEELCKIYNYRSPDYLRQCIEFRAISVALLAQKTCLSQAQVHELMDGKGSLYYSDAIKRHAYERLLKILGAPECPQSIVPLPVPEPSLALSMPTEDRRQSLIFSAKGRLCLLGGLYIVVMIMLLLPTTLTQLRPTYMLSTVRYVELHQKNSVNGANEMGQPERSSSKNLTSDSHPDGHI